MSLRDAFELGPIVGMWNEHQKCMSKNTDQRNYIFGIEIEVENTSSIRNVVNSLVASGSEQIKNSIVVIEDGSLRNNGVELKSTPVPYMEMESLLNDTYRWLNTAYPKHKFTDRCGTHFHVDANLPVTGLCAFVLAYIIYEDLFFLISDTARKENNYCTPIRWDDSFFQDFNITKSGLEAKNPWRSFYQHLPQPNRKKYSALNLCRLRDLGTFEFRHLEGTNNVRKLLLFLEAIFFIKKFSLSETAYDYISHGIKTANTETSYDLITKRIFDGCSPVLQSKLSELTIDSLEDGITCAKQFFYKKTQSVDKLALIKNRRLREKVDFLADPNLKGQVQKATRSNSNWRRLELWPVDRGAEERPQAVELADFREAVLQRNQAAPQAVGLAPGFPGAIFDNMFVQLQQNEGENN